MGISLVKHNMLAKSIKPLMFMLSKTPDRLFYSLISRIDKTEHKKGNIFLNHLFLAFKKKYPKLSKNVRKKLVESFIYNALIHGTRKARAYKEEHNCHVPIFFVISPTMRCNLNCYGCYAGEYTKKDDLPFELLDRILTEAKEMGIYFLTISGGEPFFRKDLLDLYEKHNDMYFQIYTNGTLIDKELAKKLAELGNVLPCISVEGFEKETDLRRGKGAFKKITQAMDNLREAGCLFGFSATATRENNELIVSDKFVNFYEKKGCFIGWYFNYIPIGKKPCTELMPTSDQRAYRLKRLNKLREKPREIVMADFWNDGYLTGGCIAGGRAYFHINVNGDVEPCVFCHFAKDNIKNVSLREAVNSDFFEAIRSKQPYNENYLLPCMIIDNNEVLQEVVKKCKAYPTHKGADTIIKRPICSCLNSLSKEWQEIADNIPMDQR